MRNQLPDGTSSIPLSRAMIRPKLGLVLRRPAPHCSYRPHDTSTWANSALLLIWCGATWSFSRLAEIPNCGYAQRYVTATQIIADHSLILLTHPTNQRRGVNWRACAGKSMTGGPPRRLILCIEPGCGTYIGSPIGVNTKRDDPQG